MISRSIFDIEELERVEAKKAVKIEETSRSLGEDPFITIYKFTDIKDRHHPNLQEVDK